jgi:hypothetical protein
VRYLRFNPPHESYLRLAHSTADILVSPLNDSFLDLDVLAMVDPVTFAVNRGQSLCGDGACCAALPPIESTRSSPTAW